MGSQNLLENNDSPEIIMQWNLNVAVQLEVLC